jgi:hypothetical protein
MRHINLNLAALAAQGLRGGAVARVAGLVATRGVLFIAEVMSQFAVEGALNHSLRWGKENRSGAHPNLVVNPCGLVLWFGASTGTVLPAVCVPSFKGMKLF